MTQTLESKPAPGREDMTHFKANVKNEADGFEHVKLQGTEKRSLLLMANSPTLEMDCPTVQELTFLLQDFLDEADPVTNELRPLHNKAVVKVIEPKEKTSGGILLPQTSKDAPSEGIVLAVGPGKQLTDGTRAPVSVRPGDHVLFGRHAGKEFEQGGEKLQLISETDILGIFEPEQAKAEPAAHQLQPGETLPFQAGISFPKADFQNAESITANISEPDPDGALWLVVRIEPPVGATAIHMVPINEQARTADARLKGLLADGAADQVLPMLDALQPEEE